MNKSQSMTQEALKLTLEALRMPIKYWNKTQYIKVQEAIKVAEKALAQPEQEPVTLTNTILRRTSTPQTRKPPTA
jgi:hypothetical protein